MQEYIERVIDLTDPYETELINLNPDEARQRMLEGAPESVRNFDGSFALVAKNGKEVKLARSLDRPLRYFLAKQIEGPALIVAHRIDTIRQWLEEQGFGDQFHPYYTRMVPAHYLVTIQLVGCPDPDPTYERFFNPVRNKYSTDLDPIGKDYIAALKSEVRKWIERISENEPIGCCFSGGIDSGAVFLATYSVMRELDCDMGRLKAFTLSFGDGPDLQQCKDFLSQVNMEMFLEPIDASLEDIDVAETIQIVEDYKILDIESASMAVALCRGIRKKYPKWKHLIDGDGGDENLKDYPIEENPELTIRSVVNNRMLYQEGWGVGTIKHSLTYSGGLSRSYARTYAPGHHFGFKGFSPFTRPDVVEVAEGIPFIELTDYDIDKLYSLKGDVVARGVKSVLGFDMPVYEKRRFQHGATTVDSLRENIPAREGKLRKKFLELYS
ncbi:MAG: asparagine synthase-related protein [Verrucomicrobiota bacterium]|nr:asparagine synthase-related protein [Verrucomicrobiota bacterium]